MFTFRSLIFCRRLTGREHSSTNNNLVKKDVERRQVNSKNEINQMISGKNNKENIETSHLDNRIDQVEKTNSGQSTVTECDSINKQNFTKHNISSLISQSNQQNNSEMCHHVKSNSYSSNSIHSNEQNIDQLSNHDGQPTSNMKNSSNNKIIYDEKEPIFQSFRSKLSTFESLSSSVGYVSPQLRKSQSTDKFHYESQANEKNLLKDTQSSRNQEELSHQQNLERTKSNP